MPSPLTARVTALNREGPSLPQCWPCSYSHLPDNAPSAHLPPTFRGLHSLLQSSHTLRRFLLLPKQTLLHQKEKKKLHLCTDIKTSLTPVHIFPKLKIRASRSGCDARRAPPHSRARERIVTRKVGTPEVDDCQHWAHRPAVS